MKRLLPFLLLLFILASCVVKKRTTFSNERRITVEASPDSVVVNADKTLIETPSTNIPSTISNAVVNTALSFSGVRYRYGGTTKKGMDCSGLLYVSFKEHDIDIPRVSHEIANEGKRIRVNQVEKGDLLFFKTRKRGKKINHVGLVIAVVNDDIKFIHASTSRGVIVSSLREGFWNYAFVKATRIL